MVNLDCYKFLAVEYVGDDEGVAALLADSEVAFDEPSARVAPDHLTSLKRPADGSSFVGDHGLANLTVA